ncbi:MAG TPA: TasA family protein [Acidimicrobiales bacterium]
MTKARKLLATALVVGLVGTVGGWATYAAFSSTTSSAGNRFAAGTVALGSNASGSWMYQVSNAEPSDSVTRCTKVTYNGTLESAVRLYASPVGAVGDQIDLTITAGTGDPTFPGCTGFVADSGPAVYTGTLKGFADAHNSFASGFSDAPGSATTWVQNDAVVYQFTLTLKDVAAANGGATPLSTGDHTFTWEAQNV